MKWNKIQIKQNSKSRLPTRAILWCRSWKWDSFSLQFERTVSEYNNSSRESLGKEKMDQNGGLRTFASLINLLFELTREIRLMIFMSRDNWDNWKYVLLKKICFSLFIRFIKRPLGFFSNFWNTRWEYSLVLKRIQRKQTFREEERLRLSDRKSIPMT